MKKQNKNPYNSFLFSFPGEHGKYTYDEMRAVKNINIKEVDVIDVQSKQRLGRMSALAALLKFS